MAPKPIFTTGKTFTFTSSKAPVKPTEYFKEEDFVLLDS